MKKIIKALIFIPILFNLESCMFGGAKKLQLSKNVYKNQLNSNPISENVFCADPTGIEYNGRLYIYGTSDHQQYEAVGKKGKNTYEKIKSIECFSTDDMVNWTYHGPIDVEAIAPWIVASWAPSICSRVEEDGLTHFYLYFSNSGCGVGVITSTSPTGPWTSPLNHSLVSAGMKTPFGQLKDCPTPFDPGVCIDENGDGWLTFGAGIAKNGSKEYPGSARIVKLGKDMISFASDFVKINAPYNFEASEINYINGTYVYTFNSSWDPRDKWEEAAPVSTACSMNYMTSRTPLVSESWVYQGNYFKNPGEQNLCYSNNHSHFMKYKGEYYFFYHTLILQQKMGFDAGMRSLMVDKMTVDEDAVKLEMVEGTRKGVSAIKNLNPYEKVPGTTMATGAEIWYEDRSDPENIGAKATVSGSWLCLHNVDFGKDSPKKLVAECKGTGNILMTIDKPGSAPVAQVRCGKKYKAQEGGFTTAVTGVHDVFILFTDADSVLKSWYIK